MAQYSIGGANVTNGSTTVTGIGTKWASEVSVGDWFKVPDLPAHYTVTVVNSDTSITISPAYQHNTSNNINYQIGRDFTPNLGLPLIYRSDYDTAYLYSEAMLMLDDADDLQAVVKNTPQQQVLDGGLITSGLSVALGGLTVTAPGTSSVPTVPPNALHVFTAGHLSDGDPDSGITIESYEPTLELVDRTSDSANFAINANGDYLRIHADPESNGTYNQILTLKEDGFLNVDGVIQTSGGKFVCKGSSTGNANSAFIEFRQGDNSRTGYVGDSATTNQAMYIVAEKGYLYMRSTGTALFETTGTSDTIFTIDNKNTNRDSILRLQTANNNHWSLYNDESQLNNFDIRYNGERRAYLTKAGVLSLVGEGAGVAALPQIRFNDSAGAQIGKMGVLADTTSNMYLQSTVAGILLDSKQSISGYSESGYFTFRGDGASTQTVFNVQHATGDPILKLEQTSTADDWKLRFSTGPKTLQFQYNDVLKAQYYITSGATVHTLRGGTTGNACQAFSKYEDLVGASLGRVGSISSTNNHMYVKSELGSVVLDSYNDVVCVIPGGDFHIRGSTTGWQTLLIESEVAGTDPVLVLKNSASDNNWTMRLDDSDGQALDYRFNNLTRAKLRSDGDLEVVGKVQKTICTSLKTPALVNSWVNYGGTWADSKYYIDASGFVHLQGMVRDGAGSTVLFTLPTGYRPSDGKSHVFNVRTSNGTARINVRYTGEVHCESYSGTWISLDGISVYAG